jgi:orotidine-5'-phosphate decarboxylase
MGSDTVAPFVEAARAAGAGVFVLVRTSNPGAAEIEDALLAGGAPVWESVAAMVAAAGGPAGGSLSDVGAVIGATAPAHLERARELLPNAPFLLPGVGAQGGAVADLAPAFAPGRAGGLVTVSRAIVGAGPGGARAAAEGLRKLAWALPAG